MPQTARRAPGGMVFHVLNRGVGRMRLFDKPGDDEAFVRVLLETLKLRPMRLLAGLLHDAQRLAYGAVAGGRRPFGGTAWTQATIARLGLESAVRKAGQADQDAGPLSIIKPVPFSEPLIKE